MQKPYKRKLKNFLINRSFQLNILLNSLLYFVLVVMITMGIILYPMIQDMFFSTDPEIQYRAAQSFISVAGRLIPSLLILLVLVFTHQVIVSHRICGPLVNFFHTFNRMAAGDFTRMIFLREKDYLKPESRIINDTLKQMSRFIQQITSDTVQIELSVDTFRPEIDDPDIRKQFESFISDLKNQASKLKTDLSEFKTLDS